jgi:hypothetical protein
VGSNCASTPAASSRPRRIVGWPFTNCGTSIHPLSRYSLSRRCRAPLARACGGHGFGARQPGQLHAEITEALAIDGPAIVDCVVAADEMPNLPHIDLDKIGHYAVAKIKEAVLAVTWR